MSTYDEKLRELERLKAEYRKLSAQIERDARNAQPVLEDEERRMYADQARYDEGYIACGRKAPPPMANEHEGPYRRRLADGLKSVSPRWAKADVTAMPDEAFKIASEQIRADALEHGRFAGLRPGQIRERETRGHGGHKVIEFDGGADAHFVDQFARPIYRGIFKSPAEYAAMSRDANAARIDTIIRGYQRPLVQAPRAAF